MNDILLRAFELLLLFHGDDDGKGSHDDDDTNSVGDDNNDFDYIYGYGSIDVNAVFY